MRISRLHFLSKDEEHAPMVLETICAAPKPPYPQTAAPPPSASSTPPPPPG